MSSANEGAFEKAAALLRRAHHAVAFTGAGISTPSGIPDFRSQGSGLWEKFDPMEVASLRVFQTHPERFFNWLRPLLRDIWAARPNPAHLALAQLETAGILKAVITQNIDDLHQQGGSISVYELHGSLRSMTCPHCHGEHNSHDFRKLLETGDSGDSLPYCPACGQVLKPDITLFGEMLPADAWGKAEQHCQQADVILVIGSSLEVWPAAMLPEMAVQHGADLIINNLSATPLDKNAQALLRLDVAETLPELVRRVL